MTLEIEEAVLEIKNGIYNLRKINADDLSETGYTKLEDAIDYLRSALEYLGSRED